MVKHSKDCPCHNCADRRLGSWAGIGIGLVLLALFLGFAARKAYGAQPDLGHALYTKGYTSTIWVNSFAGGAVPYAAHSAFDPNGTGPERYGQTVTGTATVSIAPDGTISASGTAANLYAVPADGSLLVDLDEDGAFQDQALIPFSAPSHGTVSWSAVFATKATAGHLYSAWVYRHPQGSVCGGELNIDLNSCRQTLNGYFDLPAGYLFTQTDLLDTDYASIPGATTTALCAIIKPLCVPAPPPVNPPPVNPPPGNPSPQNPICLTPGCHPECGCVPTPPPVTPPPVTCPVCPTCPAPPPPVVCAPPPTLTPISQKARDACKALLAAVKPGSGAYRQRKDACEPTTKGTDYKPFGGAVVPSTGLNVITLSPCPPASTLRECLGVAP